MTSRETYLKEKNNNDLDNSNSYIIFQPFRIDIDWLSNLNEIFNKNNQIIKSSYLNSNGEKSSKKRSKSCLSLVNLSSASINSNDNNNNNNQDETNIIHKNDHASSSKLSHKISKIFQKYRLKSIMSFKHTDESDENTTYFEESEAYMMRNLSLCKNEQEAFKILERLWRDSKLCDLILIVDGHEYLIHRIVLAFHSDKFRKHFEMNKHEFVTRIDLVETHASAIQPIINYLYKRKIRFSLNSIEKIIKCAQELDLKKLIEMCQDSLVKYTKRKINQLN